MALALVILGSFVLSKTVFGRMLYAIGNNGLLLLGMGDFARQIVTGLIIVAAVVIDTYRAKLLVRFQ